MVQHDAILQNLPAVLMDFCSSADGPSEEELCEDELSDERPWNAGMPHPVHWLSDPKAA